MASARAICENAAFHVDSCFEGLFEVLAKSGYEEPRSFLWVNLSCYHARVTTSCQRPASANAFAATRGALREVLPHVKTRHRSFHLERSTTGSSRSDEKMPVVSSCDINCSRGPGTMRRNELTLVGKTLRGEQQANLISIGKDGEHAFHCQQREDSLLKA